MKRIILVILSVIIVSAASNVCYAGILDQPYQMTRRDWLENKINSLFSNIVSSEQAEGIMITGITFEIKENKNKIFLNIDILNDKEQDKEDLKNIKKKIIQGVKGIAKLNSWSENLKIKKIE